MRPATSDWLRGALLPGHWPEVQIKHLVALMRAGSTITADQIEDDGRFPVYGGNGLRGYTTGFTHDGLRILVGRQGALCGNVRLVSGQFWASEHAIVLEADEGVDASWLTYLLMVMDLGQYSQTAAQPGIGTATIARLTAAVPPVGEQRAIADYLDRETAQIDTLIAKQEQLIATLRERSRSVLDAFAASTSGTPAKLKRLFRPSSETSRGDEEVLSVFREHGVVVKSARDGNFNRTPEDVSRYLRVREGDLVVNKMKAWQGSLGISPYGGIVSGDYEVAHPVDGRLVPEFAHAYLRSPRMVSEYAMRSTGIRPAQWRLYWDQLGSVEIPVPDHLAQRRALAQLNDQTSGMNILIAKAERFIELAKERRAALIAAAVTGQVDVTVTS